MDLIEAVCRLPLEDQATGRSHVDLVHRTGYLDRRGEVTIDRLHAYLSERPELIDAWQIWVTDNRSTPAWYFKDVSPGRFEVGQVGRDGRMVASLVFDDRARACAEYIVRDVEQIAGIAESVLRPWTWIGKRLRRRSQARRGESSDRTT